MASLKSGGRGARATNARLAGCALVAAHSCFRYEGSTNGRSYYEININAEKLRLIMEVGLQFQHIVALGKNRGEEIGIERPGSSMPTQTMA